MMLPYKSMELSIENAVRTNNEKAKNKGKTKRHKIPRTKLIDKPIMEIRVAVFRSIVIPFFLNRLPAHFIRPF